MSKNLNEFIDKIVEEARKDIHFPYNELASQLNLVEKGKIEADKKLANITDKDVPYWAILHYNCALINTISAFEFFFRELILNESIVDSEHKKKYYNTEKGQFKNFQKYEQIQEFLKAEFKIDIETKLSPLEIEWLRLLLIERHLLIHNGGIIDKDFMDLPYLSKLKVSGYSVGKRLWVESDHVDILIKIVRTVGKNVDDYLKTLDGQPIAIEKV